MTDRSRNPKLTRDLPVTVKMVPGVDDAELLAHAVLTWLRLRGPEALGGEPSAEHLAGSRAGAGVSDRSRDLRENPS